MPEINRITLNKAINFKAEVEKQNTSDSVKSDLVTSPETDEFIKKTSAKPKKKKHLLRNIALGTISAIVLTYGGMVMRRKLSKPAFEEVQKCFKEIFQKDLSSDEVKALVKKYKEICKNDKTEEFTQKMIEQLKKDYGLEHVETKLNITKLKDNSLKTALERTQAGNASPLAEINIMPRTSEDFVIRSIQGETFSTGFHELKHLKQFSEAYRTDPQRFAEAIFDRNILSNPAAKEETIKNYKDRLLDTYTKIKNGDKETIKSLGLTEKEAKALSPYSIDDLMKMTYKEKGIKTDEDIFNLVRKTQIKDIRSLLDQRYGEFEPFNAGSEEYKKGLEYIEGYRNYPDFNKSYDEYRNNILEKEAWDIGAKAEKIYKYISSIWKW